ncbi:DUF1573 domain-containing protein [Candidatus Uhrbacteria bacterium]|nr:DUF1573 domain-containing protein [Candidatus Uhrbacteria bacterium]
MKVSTKIWLKKQKYNLLAVVIGVGVFVGFAVTARPTSAPASSVSSRQDKEIQAGDFKLSSSENAYDFGSISMKNGNVKHTFMVKNETEAPVTIAKMYSSCMCTNASLTRAGKTYGPFGMPGHGAIPRINQTLAPGEEAAVEVVFDPNAHGPAGVGFIARVVYLEGPSGDKFELRISANVTP